MGLSQRDKEATQPHTLLSVHDLITDAVTSHWQPLEGVTRLVTDHDAHCLCGDLWTEEQIAKSELEAISHV